MVIENGSNIENCGKVIRIMFYAALFDEKMLFLLRFLRSSDKISLKLLKNALNYQIDIVWRLTSGKVTIN